MRGYHDIGGLPLGAIERSEHDYALWEKRVDAMLVLLSRKGLVTTDELRLGIETLGADAYERLSYYERWIASITRALVARGVITTDELGRRMAAAARGDAA
jgi:nitrile hydratase subunit beta